MKTYIVDSFTKEPFKGNPAGVCFPELDLDDKTMLSIASEFGLSETAFVRQTDKPDIFTIRFFSPKKEIPLCGHATLASATIIFNESRLDMIHFKTVGNLDLAIRRQGQEIEMEFPVYNTVPFTVPQDMLKALGVDTAINTTFSPNSGIILLEIEDVMALAGLTPDYGALMRSYDGINGVLVTAVSKTDGFDYHYRYFWPWAGTNEDPVTGGVQTFLAKYWSERLNKNKMRAFQSSARTGYMNIELRGDKVLLTSRAVVILTGETVAVG